MKLKMIPFLCLFLLTGCGGSAAADGYTKITAQEALQQISQNPDAIIVDVRTKEEYAEGHVAKAILIPNETISNVPPTELPDKNAEIYVYCRSGNRSAQAGKKLSDMGYKHVYDFGAFSNWTGEVSK
ncbi:hypothetical protein TAMA11512_09860 [Selenomonas sp. TAMA-11512]|uniref:rhodanese-like domain-containing protein n=1 Tax=Selenomonas sp. TAMA-11512 TaxID=3095337 RepID=UPI0030904322|nr:hypothetical protein TAMA11512_09860 [Selenomonas sp. TAMA-11512]